jgi:hypothetical protein
MIQRPAWMGQQTICRRMSSLMGYDNKNLNYNSDNTKDLITLDCNRLQ